MKAVVHTEYGGPEVLRLVEVDRPAPRDAEVLVRVRACSLNASDWEGLRGTPAYARIGGLRRPRRHVLGSDVAGTVESVGARVTAVGPGDDVFADVLGRNGGLAELVVVPERALAPMPSGMTYVEAAAVPQAAAIALHGIRTKGRVRPGDRVLVNGAGGGAGTYAVQLAKLDGAEVTAVDNAEKLDLLRSLGADHVVDYRTHDYTAAGRTYDLVLDLAGHRSVRHSARAIAPGGRYLFVGGSLRSLLGVLLLGPLVGLRGRRRIRVLAVGLGVRQVTPLVELVLAGDVRTVVDRVYPLAEAPEALRRLGEGHALGKVVVEVDAAGAPPH
ncbi:NADPH:quinone reductase [Cellulomonas chitinilytica]|uniref:NADPH:quinone reductase n=1 Tax=Cellulomonas chitinilytica TaxID=398759 RepID=A0A919P7H8_9CELL|nr:NAD(P)-dependent alcohol dehydrogenase [Cellulomonas chitinilytica]GIG23552.1 NADPH:quinone reductase [Cellulomonas chitinilytica]